jgi:hypothetical protein
MTFVRIFLLGRSSGSFPAPSTTKTMAGIHCTVPEPPLQPSYAHRGLLCCWRLFRSGRFCHQNHWNGLTAVHSDAGGGCNCCSCSLQQLTNITINSLMDTDQWGSGCFSCQSQPQQSASCLLTTLCSCDSIALLDLCLSASAVCSIFTSSLLRWVVCSTRSLSLSICSSSLLRWVVCSPGGLIGSHLNYCLQVMVGCTATA